jgi:hypothetical protein
MLLLPAAFTANPHPPPPPPPPPQLPLLLPPGHHHCHRHHRHLKVRQEEFWGGHWIFVHMYVLVWGTVSEIFNTNILCGGNFGVGTHTQKFPNSLTFQHIADILPTCCQHSQLSWGKFFGYQ